MDIVRFGVSGLKVSRFGMGSMTFGDTVDEAKSRQLLDVAHEHGVNLYDTANLYAGGRSEEILGRWIKARGVRDSIVLTSKVRYAVGGDPITVGLTPKVIIRELDASLRRLQTDYLDIYFLHQPDDDTRIDVTCRCLDTLFDSGKIRYIGVSNFAAWQIVEAIHISARNHWAQPLITQFMYNLLARGPERELLPMTRAYDLGNMIYNPLAGGLLSGKHRTHEEAMEGTRLADNKMYRERYWNPRQREAAEKLRQTAKNYGRTAVELALRFLLDSDNVHTILLGATKLEQLEQNLRVLEAKPIRDSERAACDEIWQALHGPVPAYHRGGGVTPPREPIK